MNRPAVSLSFVILVSLLILSTFTCAQVGPAIQPDWSPDTRSDIHAFAKYKAAVRELFEQNNYEALDQLADSLRSSKEKFSGGYRKLTSVYFALQAPAGEAPSDTDWQQHIAHLKQWQMARPDSTAARVVLAAAYLQYSYVARGDGTASNVASEAWKQYQQRTESARKILEQAGARIAQDPVAMWIMLCVAQNQGWDRSQERSLFEKAIAMDPNYRAFYRQHALYLRPEWYGAEGDVAKFAEETYQRLGPVNGAIMYFEIATVTVCNCGPTSDGHKLSVAKIKRGFEQTTKEYGESIEQLNQFAYMSFLLEDTLALERSLARIGNRFVMEIWQQEEYIQSARASLVPPSNFGSEPFTSIAAELKTSEGQDFAKRIQADFDTQNKKVLDECRAKTDDLRGFYIYIREDGAGDMNRSFLYPGGSGFMRCFMDGVKDAGKPHFIAPPHSDYWSRIVVSDQ